MPPFGGGGDFFAALLDSVAVELKAAKGFFCFVVAAAAAAEEADGPSEWVKDAKGFLCFALVGKFEVAAPLDLMPVLPPALLLPTLIGVLLLRLVEPNVGFGGTFVIMNLSRPLFFCVACTGAAAAAATDFLGW